MGGSPQRRADDVLMNVMLSDQWLVSGACARLLLSKYENMDIDALPDSAEVRADSDPMSAFVRVDERSGVGWLKIKGVLCKDPMPSRVFGESYSLTYPEIAAALEMLSEDDRVSAIVMRIDSPGGSFEGLSDAAAAVRRASDNKPTAAYCADRCLSGAYWLASQADEIYASETSRTGSIGAYSLLTDSTEMMEKEGIKRTLVSTGGVKGLGADGSVSAELVEDVRKGLMQVLDFFTTAIADGRGMSKSDVDALATGEEWFGADALRLGLTDGLEEWSVFRDSRRLRRSPAVGGSRKSAVTGGEDASEIESGDRPQRAAPASGDRAVKEEKAVENEKDLQDELLEEAAEGGGDRGEADSDISPGAEDVLGRVRTEKERAYRARLAKSEGERVKLEKEARERAAKLRETLRTEFCEELVEGGRLLPKRRPQLERFLRNVQATADGDALFIEAVNLFRGCFGDNPPIEYSEIAASIEEWEEESLQAEARAMLKRAGYQPRKTENGGK